jgi:Kef-type K+ transport system membrane component KefB
MGFQMNLSSLFQLSKNDPSIFLFFGVLVICAVAGKLICGLVVPGSFYDKCAIGLGMVPRGEVGLILANFGLSEGILQQPYFAALVLVVIVTTFLGSSTFKQVVMKATGQGRTWQQ